MCKANYAKAVDKMIFPGIQGGPLAHVIAAKAVAFKEALSTEFEDYQKMMVENSRRLAGGLIKHGFKIMSGGTDNHLMLVDLTETGVTGKEAEEALDKAGVTVNKNAIPYDSNPPAITSGIRLGTPCVTTRGMGAAEMDEIADIIAGVIKNIQDPAIAGVMNKRVQALCAKFPIYAS